MSADVTWVRTTACSKQNNPIPCLAGRINDQACDGVVVERRDSKVLDVGVLSNHARGRTRALVGTIEIAAVEQSHWTINMNKSADSLQKIFSELLQQRYAGRAFHGFKENT